MQKLHVKLIRTTAPWAAYERTGRGQMEVARFAALDRLVAGAAARGIKVILTADMTPCWASSAPASLLARCVPGRESAADAWPPRDPADYAEYVAFLARRYGTQLAAIEIWNEPDQSNEAYFAGPEKPQRYAAVLRAAYPAIKAANSQVTVLGGSLVGSNGKFLRALYAAGIKGYYDALAVHYYNLTIASLRSIHEVQLANGDPTPLWLDEFGWTSCWPKIKREQEQPCVSPQVQARNLTNVVHELAATSYVDAAVVYKLQDSSREAFGVLSEKGARKRSFNALAAAFARPRGPVEGTHLTLGRRRGRVQVSGSGPVGDFMAVEAFVGGTLRYQAYLVMDRFNHFAISLPSVLGTSNVSVRVYSYGAGLAYASRRSI